MIISKTVIPEPKKKLRIKKDQPNMLLSLHGKGFGNLFK
jgi:hypothetical protein